MCFSLTKPTAQHMAIDLLQKLRMRRNDCQFDYLLKSYRCLLLTISKPDCQNTVPSAEIT